MLIMIAAQTSKGVNHFYRHCMFRQGPDCTLATAGVLLDLMFFVSVSFYLGIISHYHAALAEEWSNAQMNTSVRCGNFVNFDELEVSAIKWHGEHIMSPTTILNNPHQQHPVKGQLLQALCNPFLTRSIQKHVNIIYR